MSRPFIPAANCASFELIYTYGGNTVENVMHVHKGSPYSAADLAALRTIVNTWDSTSWVNLRTSGCTLIRIKSKALDSVGSPMEDYYLPTPRVGAIAGTLFPGNVTWAIKLATGLSGRSYRGRLFVPGIGVAVVGVNQNEMAAASAVQYLASLNLLLANLAAGGHTLGVLSYMSGGAWRANGLFTPATGWVQTDLHFDSQRRRLTGRGI